MVIKKVHNSCISVLEASRVKLWILRKTETLRHKVTFGNERLSAVERVRRFKEELAFILDFPISCDAFPLRVYWRSAYNDSWNRGLFLLWKIYLLYRSLFLCPVRTYRRITCECSIVRSYKFIHLHASYLYITVRSLLCRENVDNFCSFLLLCTTIDDRNDDLDFVTWLRSSFLEFQGILVCQILISYIGKNIRRRKRNIHTYVCAEWFLLDNI